MRKMDKAKMIHKDHVGAVMDVAYSPTGRELVTGSYDRYCPYLSSPIWEKFSNISYKTNATCILY